MKIVATNFELSLIFKFVDEEIMKEFEFHSIESVIANPSLNEKCLILLANIECELNSEILSRLKNLKYLISPATGDTHIDKKYISKRGISTISLPHFPDLMSSITSSAEFAWGLFLDLHRGLTLANRRAHYFPEFRNEYWSRQVAGMKIGIIGYGRIGRRIKLYAEAFGADVIITELDKAKVDDGAKSASLSKLLVNSDAIFLCASVKNNSIILDKRHLNLVKRSAILINISRGCLVNEIEVLNALREKKLRGYATDVLGQFDSYFEGKVPMSRLELENAISEDLNLLVTPHIGGTSSDAFASIIKVLLGNIPELD